MNDIEIDLKNLLDQAIISHVFPSYAAGICVLGKYNKKESLIISGSNKNITGKNKELSRPYYDLASLTKPLATALIMVSLVGVGKVKLTDPLEQYLPGLPEDKRWITLFQLLNHSSGLPAHRPYFESLRTLPAEARREAVLAMLLNEPLASHPGENVVYSDLGFILLGYIIEEKSKQTLDRFVAQSVYAPLGLEGRIVFNPLAVKTVSDEGCFAPTEVCPWRGRVLQGEVHDDNARVMGGVAGHAGLFGATAAVLTLTRFLLDLIKGRAEHPCIEARDLREAVCRCGLPGSTWGLGFDTPSETQSSAGTLLSRLSFGHLGYTGTSFWCDPERDLAVVLFTNRVHPSRENALIRQFRPRFHDAVARCCDVSAAAGSGQKFA